MITDYPVAKQVMQSLAENLHVYAKDVAGLEVVNATQTNEHYCLHLTYLGEKFYMFVEDKTEKSLIVRMSRMSGEKRVGKNTEATRRRLKDIVEWSIFRIEDKMMGIDYKRQLNTTSDLNRMLTNSAVKESELKGEKSINDDGFFQIGKLVNGRTYSEQPESSRVELNVTKLTIAPEKLQQALKLIEELERL